MFNVSSSFRKVCRDVVYFQNERLIKSMENIAGNSLDSVFFCIDMDGYIYFGENLSSYRYTLHYKEWLAQIHHDDVEHVENIIFQLFTYETPSASITFRRQGIDGVYLELTCQCKIVVHQGKYRIEGVQETYYAKFDQDKHICHQHWVASRYHFFHYKKLLDDMNRLGDSQTPCTLFYFNINKVKTLVSQYGYDVLDRIYSCIYNALNDLSIYPICRYQSILGNFVSIVGHSFNSNELEEICDRIFSHSKDLANLNPMIDLCDMRVGIMTLPPRQSESPRDILRHLARTSEYALKGNECKWAIHDENKHSKLARHFFVEKELRGAIRNNELTVKFQPIINAKTNKPCSVEILSRWENSALGEIYPDEFIPVAESQNWIVQLGWQVFNQACQFLSGLPNDSTLSVNVNVSVLQLQNISFATEALSIAMEHQVSPSRIIMEITESLFLDTSSMAGAQLLALSQLGFKLSLDDFGSGYSTLNNLFSLPINQIKLDKETVNKAMQNEEAMNYVCFLIDMCRRNDVEFLVEGIENADMNACYRQKNVHCMQGFYFSKPMDDKTTIEYLGYANNKRPKNRAKP